MSKLDRLAFWEIRSKWDYLAFPALLQWVLVAGAVAALALPKDVFIALFMGVLVMNALASLSVLAVGFGSRSHDHLDPGWLYILSALFFGPVVGVHYLWRTGQA